MLDANCKAHELDNLYVVDTSFFPSIGAVNPALTAMANAVRVGDHLLERMGAPCRRADATAVSVMSGDAQARGDRRRRLRRARAAPQRLAKHDDVDVTLIDRNNYHQFQPLLYQVATSQLAPSDIAHSLRSVFAGEENVDVKLADIAAVDPATRDRDRDRRRALDRRRAGARGRVAAELLRHAGRARELVPVCTRSTTRRACARASSGCFEQVDRDPSWSTAAR